MTLLFGHSESFIFACQTFQSMWHNFNVVAVVSDKVSKVIVDVKVCTQIENFCCFVKIAKLIFNRNSRFKKVS